MSKSTKTNHYTYIIRHIHGKYYVGRRSTKKDPLLDPYMGSGKWVKSIKDRSTLTKTIIAYYDTFDELKVGEMELIEKYFDDVYCMNMLYSSGGCVSGDRHHMYGQTHTKEARQKISDSRTRFVGDKHPRFGTTHTEESKQKMSDAQSGHKSHMYGKRGKLCANFGKTSSQETKQLISNATSGENNPNVTITEAIVTLILIRISEGVKDRPISEEYNTTENVVSKIRHKRTWKHITI